MSTLTDRDINVQPTSGSASYDKDMTSGAERKTQDEQQHKQVLEQKSVGIKGKQSGAYISPSDAILSPASHKLANFKQRQINKPIAKNSAARTLFGRTPSTCSSTFDDINTRS